MEELKKKPRTYPENGPARKLIDPEQSKAIRAVESRIKKKLEWKGDEELEELCNMFVVQLTAPSGINLEASTPPKGIPPEAPSPGKVGGSASKLGSPVKLAKVIKEDDNEEDDDP